MRTILRFLCSSSMTFAALILAVSLTTTRNAFADVIPVSNCKKQCSCQYDTNDNLVCLGSGNVSGCSTNCTCTTNGCLNQ